MTLELEVSWKYHLRKEFKKPYWRKLVNFVQYEYSNKICLPESQYIFRAFNTTPFYNVKVIILGQDPYHTPGIAMGYCFSVPNNSNYLPPSLKNIFKEMKNDLGIKRSETDLTDLAKQGVFLLNSILTVCAGKAGSHAKKGWEFFTDSVIQCLSNKHKNLLFILWGNYAISKKIYIDQSKHYIISSSHPSPLSVNKGFFGSRPFSLTNKYLISKNINPINWINK